MHVCMYVCMHACMAVYIFVCIWKDVNVYLDLQSSAVFFWNIHIIWKHPSNLCFISISSLVLSDWLFGSARVRLWSGLLCLILSQLCPRPNVVLWALARLKEIEGCSLNGEPKERPVARNLQEEFGDSQASTQEELLMHWDIITMYHHVSCSHSLPRWKTQPERIGKQPWTWVRKTSVSHSVNFRVMG